jgi:hypothetical protein
MLEFPVDVLQHLTVRARGWHPGVDLPARPAMQNATVLEVKVTSETASLGDTNHLQRRVFVNVIAQMRLKNPYRFLIDVRVGCQLAFAMCRPRHLRDHGFMFGGPRRVCDEGTVDAFALASGVLEDLQKRLGRSFMKCPENIF